MTGASPTLTKKDACLITMLVVAALSIRLYFLQFYDVISADGISYITIAKDFITGKGLAASTHYPPFYPILVGLASVSLKDFETAGLAVSVAMGSLVVVPVYLLGSEFFSKKTGFVAAVLSITWPTIRYWSTAVMSQATYITLLLFGIYFLWRAYRNNAVLSGILAGCFFGCAHLTRSEGVLVLVAVSSVLVFSTFANRSPAKSLLFVLVSWCAFLAVFSPYLYLLHDLTGKWQLTGKSRIAIADALSEYLGKPDLKHDPSFKELGYPDLFRLYPEYIRTNWLKNLRSCWNDMLPFYGWILAGIGFAAGPWGREKLSAQAYLCATFVPLGVIIFFFFIGPEYTQPYLPVLFLWVGNGLFFLEDRLASVMKTEKEWARSKSLWYVTIALVMTYGAYNVVKNVPADRDKPYDYTRDGGRFDDKRIGLKLRNMLPDNAVLMTRSGRIGFYSQRQYVLPPQTDYPGIIDYARKNKVNYLIATIQLLNMRQQLQFLFGPILEPERQFVPPPELELVYIGQEPGGLPYIIYRLR